MLALLLGEPLENAAGEPLKALLPASTRQVAGMRNAIMLLDVEHWALGLVGRVTPAGSQG